MLPVSDCSEIISRKFESDQAGEFKPVIYATVYINMRDSPSNSIETSKPVCLLSVHVLSRL